MSLLTNVLLPTTRWRKQVLFYGVIVFFAVPLAFYQIYANDIWKALYSGRYLAMFHQFPHHSTFSFSPVKDFYSRDAYNWLGNLVLLGIFRAGGVTLLQAFRFVIVLFATLLPLKLLKSRWKAITLVLVLCYLFAIKQKLIMRTALFSVPGVAVLFWILLRSERIESAKLLWGLPVLFVFWSNMHGSYLAGVGFLILAWIGSVLDNWWNSEETNRYRPTRLGLVVVAVLLVVTFVKPFPDYKFWNQATSISKRSVTMIGGAFGSLAGVAEAPSVPQDGSNTGRDGPTEQTESIWNSPVTLVKNLVFPSKSWRSSEYGFPLFRYSLLFVSMSLALFPLGFAIFVMGREHFRFYHFLPVLGAFILSVAYLRTIGYFSLVIFPVTLWKVREGHFASVKLGEVVHKASTIAVAILSLNMGYYLVRGEVNRFFNVSKMKLKQQFTVRFSEGMPRHLLRRYPDEHFLTHYNIAGYLIWKWWPYKRVFFDSKGSAYKDEFFRNYGVLPQIRLMDLYNLDFVVNPHNPPVNYKYYIPNKKWNLVGFDSGMVSFGRASRVDPPDPYKVFMMTPDEFRALPERFQKGLREFLAMYRARSNLVSLSLTEQEDEPGTFTVIKDGASSDDRKLRK